MIQKIADEYNFRYLFIWQPTIFNKPLTADEKSSLRDIPVDNDIYKSITTDVDKLAPSGFIDLSGIFQDESRQSYFVDNCHITPTANGIVANKISEEILKIQ